MVSSSRPEDLLGLGCPRLEDLKQGLMKIMFNLKVWAMKKNFKINLDADLVVGRLDYIRIMFLKEG